MDCFHQVVNNQCRSFVSFRGKNGTRRFQIQENWPLQETCSFFSYFVLNLQKCIYFLQFQSIRKKIPNHIVMKSILVHLFCYVSTNRQFLVNVVLFWIMFVFQKKIHTYIIYKNVCTLVGTAVYSGQPQAALGRGPSDRTRCGRLCMF